MNVKSQSRVSMLLASSLVAATVFMACNAAAEDPPPPPDAASVDFAWGVKIPMRDGARLNATLYTPKDRKTPAPCIFTLTPYIAQSYHDRGIYFAAHGYPFLTVDARGRGNSEGTFRPLIQEARDGHDVVEWLAKQPYCNGKISMWGGSYAGYNQWATAKEFPPHLATIVPVASPYAGVDFPMRNNIFYPYDLQWLMLTSGNASQSSIFGDDAFWASRYRRWFESGTPFKDLDTFLGIPSRTFREWLAHPHPDAYFDRYNPTAAEYAKISMPILTITGAHDGDQPGALAHYREHMKNASPETRAKHFLIIGPWDHAGTRTPSATFGGLSFGPASLVDLPKLHREWYAWTMQDGPKPEFLEKPVSYYVMAAEKWRYAGSLAAVTAETRELFLDSASNATDVLTAGSLGAARPRGAPDQYVYDPRDVSLAALEAGLDTNSFVDQSLIYARTGRHLVYHSAAFEKDTEISGFFRLSAWLAIDQPDTDFVVMVSEIRRDGSSLPLTSDVMRARYRENLREPKLITTREVLRYDFDRFMFVSRQVKAGSRLRLLIQPADSIYLQKNYNSGKAVAEESMQDARPVTVRLLHDEAHPSALYVPLGQPQ